MELLDVRELDSLIDKLKLDKAEFVATIKNIILETQNETDTAPWRITTANRIIEIVSSEESAGGEWIIWLTKLLSKESDCESYINEILLWFQSSVDSEINGVVALSAIGVILTANPQFTAHCFDQVFHSKKSILLERLECNISNSFNEEFVVAVVQCMDQMLSCLWEKKLTDVQVEVCEKMVNILLRLHYEKARTPSFLTLCTLTLISKVAVLSITYAQLHAGELFGLGKTYMQCGVCFGSEPVVPQKVLLSPQSCYESAEEFVSPEGHGSGGKVSKKRKPRAVVKGTRQLQLSNSCELDVTETIKLPVVDVITSDSDAELETAANNISKHRHLLAKIRLASITLLGVVARNVERRAIYGYWHTLFPSGIGNSHDINLMYVSRHDPNARVRSASLQLSAQLFLDSKGFLSQAESGDSHCPSSFLPFSFHLGFMILAIYAALTDILSTESSVPVLTQCLQCLAVLVQSTPFQKLQEGFVRDFMPYVRPLVFHRDSTIQVSALMTMEFLVSAPKLTAEIAEVVGLPNDSSALKLQSNEIKESLQELKHLSDDDSHERDKAELTPQTNHLKELDNNPSSWLVVQVLENLKYKSNIRISTAVRIESLQVLTSIAPHILLQSQYLQPLADSLEQALQKELPDVRQHAARCLDCYAYQICRRIPDNCGYTGQELTACDNFWMQLLPTIMNLIRDNKLAPNFSVCLLDAMSNMGSVIFARLSQYTKMKLLSFLSGISSDTTVEVAVRAAAVRVLAVFVLFPSLRDDLVFVENTAEVTLRLVNESNLLVRIKAFWSMGNISDAFITSQSEGNQDRVSNDLLMRLIAAATQACNDNDKVRCNAVRCNGNLLRLLSKHQLNDSHCRLLFQKSVQKLIDCIRFAGSAKVKWNSCYAIGNLMRNGALFKATKEHADLDWLSSLYPVLCHTIVHHSNFKVRINATVAIAHIEHREFYGVHFEAFWTAVTVAIEQSYNIENFYEYNHRDQLQEELCITACHLIHCSALDDMPALQQIALERHETLRKTWLRVANHILPEKAAPIHSCSVLLRNRLTKDIKMSVEQRKAIIFMAQILEVE